MRGAPALLAERIIARVGSRDRRSLLIHVVQAVCFVLLGGLQTLYGWSEPDTRWTVIVYGVLSLMVGMLLTGAVILGWMHMRNRARNIHDSVAHAVEPVEVDRRIHALTQDG